MPSSAGPIGFPWLYDPWASSATSPANPTMPQVASWLQSGSYPSPLLGATNKYGPLLEWPSFESLSPPTHSMPELPSGGLLGSHPIVRGGAEPSLFGGIFQDRLSDATNDARLDGGPAFDVGQSAEPSNADALTAFQPWTVGTVTSPLPAVALAATEPPLPTPGSPPAVSSDTPGSSPNLVTRIRSRIAGNFRDAAEAPLGPGPEYRRDVEPFFRSSGTWTDYLTGPFRALNRGLLIGVPEGADAALRVYGALYDSAIDAGAEAAASLGMDPGIANRLGRDLKSLPDAFPAMAGMGMLRRRGPQVHHAISKIVHRELQQHKILKDQYKYRDRRFETRAKDLESHDGWDEWHRGLDDEVAKHIRDHPDMTPQEFEDYLRRRYNEPDLKQRFPNGFEG